MTLSAFCFAYRMSTTPSGQRLSPLEKLVLIYLADNWPASDSLTYSIQEVAEFALVDHDTAANTIRSLESNGSIWAVRQEMIQDEIRDGEEIAKKKESSYQKRVISKKLKAIILQKDNYACVICKRTEDLCVDHVIPEIEGGSDEIDNLQTLCRSCNSKKGTRRAVASEKVDVMTFESLRGIGKRAFADLGGGEAFIRNECEDFYGLHTPDPSKHG